MDLERFLETLICMIASLASDIKLLLQLSLNLLLLLLFLLALALFAFALILLQFECEFKVSFDNLVVSLSPSPESLSSVTLHPVNNRLLQESALLVPIVG